VLDNGTRRARSAEGGPQSPAEQQAKKRGQIDADCW
jgi:hypothetical protein